MKNAVTQLPFLNYHNKIRLVFPQVPWSKFLTYLHNNQSPVHVIFYGMYATKAEIKQNMQVDSKMNLEG